MKNNTKEVVDKLLKNNLTEADLTSELSNYSIFTTALSKYINTDKEEDALYQKLINITKAYGEAIGVTVSNDIAKSIVDKFITQAKSSLVASKQAIKAVVTILLERK